MSDADLGLSVQTILPTTQELLRRWREAEATARACEPGTPEWEAARRTADEAREAYRARQADLAGMAAELGDVTR